MIDMSVFLAAINFAALDIVYSNTIAKIFAGAFAFALHRSFTFKVEGAPQAQAIKYIMVLSLNVPITTGILTLLSPHLPLVFAKFITDLFYFVLSFGVSKFYIFKAQPK
jgi:putative flippase GtrA